MQDEIRTATEAPQGLRALMLALGDEVFAVDVSRVREILDPVPVTQVPGARRHIDGIINVRGRVVPTADLRMRFGLALAETTIDTRFVVTEIECDGTPTLVAILADKVHEVSDIAAADMLEAPKLGMHWQPEFVRFIGKWRDSFVVVPDIERILN